MKLVPTSRAFAVFLGLLAALPPLSIDMALPAIVPITNTLHTSPDQAGLTLSLFLLGFAFTPLIYGPLADRFGRRPVLLAALALFTVAGIACAAATSITMLLVARLLQGAGAGAGITLAFVIVRDVFEGAAAQSRIALVTAVLNISPIIAPTIGAALLLWVGWRAIFAVMVLSGMVILAITAFSLDETRPARTGQDAMLPRLVRDYRRVLGHREIMTYIVVNALGLGWLFAYIAGSPVVLLGQYHVTPVTYGGLFACTGLGIMVGALANGRLAKAGVPNERVLLFAIVAALLASGALVGLTAMGMPSLLLLMPLLVLATTCFGLMTPSASHGALAPVPEVAGVVGGLLTFAQMLAASVSSWVVAWLAPRYGALGMTATMAGMVAAALVVYLPHLRTAAAPAPTAG